MCQRITIFMYKVDHRTQFDASIYIWEMFKSHESVWLTLIQTVDWIQRSKQSLINAFISLVINFIVSTVCSWMQCVCAWDGQWTMAIGHWHAQYKWSIFGAAKSLFWSMNAKCIKYYFTFSHYSICNTYLSPNSFPLPGTFHINLS